MKFKKYLFDWLFISVIFFAVSSSAKCPQYESPVCTAPDIVVHGKDAGGCAMPMCQKIKEPCPNYSTPTCADGLHLSLTADPKLKNCRKPVCVASESSPKK